MQLETEAGVWAKADATVFRLLLGANRTERRMMAVERTVAAAHRRVGLIRRLRAARAEREHAAANRRLQRALDEAWGRPIRIRQTPQARTHLHDRPRKQRAGKTISASRRLKNYAAPLIDDRGRVALFFQVKYIGLKSKTWRPGLSAAHISYIFRDDALERSADGGRSPLLGNMGQSIEEIAAAWDAIETIEQGYRANATVQHRIVWNLPHGLNADQRRKMVEDFGQRTFGRRGLPWAAAIHVPDEKGDQRNFHAHIVFSTRPCERVGDFEWEMAQEKVCGLTDPVGLKLMRALAAAHMNAACHHAGKAERYTHQTYKERGIDAVRQSHLGPARMAAHERGENVAAVARNAQIVEHNEMAAARDTVARSVVLAKRLTDLIGRGIDLAAQRGRLAALRVMAASIAQRTRAAAVRRARTVRRMSPEATSLITRIRALQARKQMQPDRVDQDRARSIAASSIQIGKRLDAQAMRKGALVQARQHLVRSQEAYHAAELARAADRAAADSARRAQEKADRGREAAIAAAKVQADAERDAHQRRAAQHELDVTQACRLLLDSEGRPYRREGGALMPDLTVFNTEERACVAKAGFKEPRLRAALVARAKQDHEDDIRAQALEQMFRVIREERHHLTSAEGKRAIPPVLLERFHITKDVVASDGVQRELARIAEEQAVERAQIIVHTQSAPQDIIWQEQRWSLGGNAPASVRALADAWRHDDLMQSILEDRAKDVAPVASAKVQVAIDVRSGVDDQGRNRGTPNSPPVAAQKTSPPPEASTDRNGPSQIHRMKNSASPGIGD